VKQGCACIWIELVAVSESAFSKELDKFIAEEIQSLEQLEILLLLSGNPHKWWTAKGAYEVIKSNPASVEARLEEMTVRRALRKETENEVRYQFAPEDPALWTIVNELRDAYKERPVKVVQAIYSKPPDAVQEFARAFRVRKEK
jgi:hypothetical protein